MRKFECVIVNNELWIIKDSKHHIALKFFLRYGKWILGCKRGCIKIRNCSKGINHLRVTMVIGSYEGSVESKIYIKEFFINILMEMTKL